jgi:hypothetical protein
MAFELTTERDIIRDVYDSLLSALTVTMDPSSPTLNVNVERVTGDISTNNSTATVLGNGATFTGVADDVADYKSIGLAVIASHASATDGLSCEFSSDGTNWDITHTFTIPATTGKFFNLPVEAQYFRIVYTNSAAVQTYFRLQVIYHATITKESTLRLSEDIDGETAAELSRSVIAGERPAGDFVNVQTTPGGYLKVSIETIGAVIGQKSSANSLPVTLSTEQEAILTAVQTALQIMDDWDATHDSAVGSDGAQIMGEAKDFDGAAMPNAVAEGDATRLASTLSGVLYTMIVSEDGSQSPYDSINNALNTQEIAPPRDREQYVQIQTATAPPDTNENQLGGDINCSQYNTITFGWDWQQAAAETVTVRIYGILTSGGNEYQLGTWGSGAGATQTKDDYAPTDNVKESLTIDVSGFALVKITLQATVAAGTFECEYLLTNNG